MKYSVEYKNGRFIELLEVDGHTAKKTWQREVTGPISGLCSHDKDFSEQLCELLEEDVLNNISMVFDDNMLVADIEDFVAVNGVE